MYSDPSPTVSVLRQYIITQCHLVNFLKDLARIRTSQRLCNGEVSLHSCLTSCLTGLDLTKQLNCNVVDCEVSKATKSKPGIPTRRPLQSMRVFSGFLILAR